MLVKPPSNEEAAKNEDGQRSKKMEKFQQKRLLKITEPPEKRSKENFLTRLLSSVFGNSGNGDAAATKCRSFEKSIWSNDPAQSSNNDNASEKEPDHRSPWRQI